MKKTQKNQDLFSSIQRALVVCPHTDDEFGCAGTILRMVEAGVEVRYLAMSRCEESVPAGFPADVLEGECRRCAVSLGIAPDHIEILDFKVRYFPEYRQPILEEFVRRNREFKPQLVLLPSTYDTHQDHATVATEGFRAFKSASILGYELPQNLILFSNSAFVSLTGRHLTAKLKALANYKSQGFRKYATEEFIRGLAKVRGVQAKVDYAEAFELVRLIIP